jgi:membrane protein
MAGERSEHTGNFLLIAATTILILTAQHYPHLKPPMFSWYVSKYLSNLGNYSATYGSLGAAMGLMMWMWMSAIIVLWGAELNSEIEHHLERDTTVGTPKPLGGRGALMADKLGPTISYRPKEH